MSESDASEPWSAADGGWTPPTVEELQPFFPKLLLEQFMTSDRTGAIYLARQPLLDRRVILKLLAPELWTDPEHAERFSQEARILGRLRDPGIVEIFDSGTTDGGHPYFLLEYEEGGTLRQWAAAASPSLTEVLDIGLSLCSPLAAAHREGIVHGDITPENVLLDREGRLKIGDFGLAEAAATGRVRYYTPGYTAPESYRGEPCGPAADIYAVGALLFELACGTTPPVDDFLRSEALAAFPPIFGGTLAVALAGEASLRPDAEGFGAILAECRAALADAAASAPKAHAPTRMRSAAAAERRRSMLGWLAIATAIAALGAFVIFMEAKRNEPATPVEEIAALSAEPTARTADATPVEPVAEPDPSAPNAPPSTPASGTGDPAVPAVSAPPSDAKAMDDALAEDKADALAAMPAARTPAVPLSELPAEARDMIFALSEFTVKKKSEAANRIVTARRVLAGKIRQQDGADPQKAFDEADRILALPIDADLIDPRSASVAKGRAHSNFAPAEWTPGITLEADGTGGSENGGPFRWREIAEGRGILALWPADFAWFDLGDFRQDRGESVNLAGERLQRERGAIWHGYDTRYHPEIAAEAAIRHKADEEIAAKRQAAIDFLRPKLEGGPRELWDRARLEIVTAGAGFSPGDSLEQLHEIPGQWLLTGQGKDVRKLVEFRSGGYLAVEHTVAGRWIWTDEMDREHLAFLYDDPQHPSSTTAAIAERAAGTMKLVSLMGDALILAEKQP